MPDIKKTGKEIESRVTLFLAGKPLWMWLGTYVLVTGILFGVFFVISKLIGYWWMYLSLILIIGIVWGAIAHSSQKKPEAKKSAPAKTKKRSR